ncbi:hypothetical protein PHISCL_00526 [Aspergillus sclerotialis]|uniref:Sm domain-containing protein n=1 Tax=Aspergillus sclerotialis TaxID=2070753 RepID=A0A3A2ZXY3_9EURO|nr:hypothetical protein PHISCL_00526 [Aspergillus sclerotialis]
MNETEAVKYLDSLIGQTLRVHTTDTRIFVGVFKCTDAERNIILATTFEYRFPAPSTVREAAAAANEKEPDTRTNPPNLKLDMTSRFIGLVVVPGQHITKIELEEKPAPAHLRGIA